MKRRHTKPGYSRSPVPPGFAFKPAEETMAEAPAPVPVWDVERKIWHQGPMGAPKCICCKVPCECAYGKAAKDPEWWLK